MTTDICTICERQKADDRYVVFENDDWIVRHSRETDILGYVLIEAKRHFLDLSDSNESECRSIGSILKDVIGCVRRAVVPERVYTVTLAEVVPHFHVHIIPRTDRVPQQFRGRGILGYPIQPPADATAVLDLCRSLQASLNSASSKAMQ